MTLFIKEYQKKVGLPPGTLIHIGHKKTDKSKISLITYNAENFEEKEITKIEDSYTKKEKTSIYWINIDGIHQTELIESVGKHFNIHPLVLADIVNTRHHPKIEDYEDYLFIVLKMIFFDDKTKENVSEQVSLILGPDYVITFQEQQGDVFDPIRDRLRTASGRIRKMGADYLAYCLIDTIIDNYFVIVEKMGEKVEDLEEELLNNPTQNTVKKIHKLKRNMIFLRRSVWPLREVTSSLERGESKLIQESTKIYLKDVYDHTIQVIDTIESSRDMLAGMLDIYLSSVSNKMNGIMKVLTIIATIFMPLTFIAGVYGMNFHNMPELSWSFGYPAVLILMLGIAIWMLAFFKRKDWL
ncbi:MAG: magnesium/cobalt transporter CorA [Candidatus Kapabacteria bacterium]|nr:magnesium/cobalt transporter CorA [Candidatus Kapabacteria bacterium]